VSWMEQCELLPSEASRGCSSRSGLCIRCRLDAHDKGRLEERGVVARHGNSIRQRGGVELRPVHQRLKQTCHENATKHENSPFELSFLASADSCPRRLFGRSNIRNLLLMSYILCLMICCCISCHMLYLMACVLLFVSYLHDLDFHHDAHNSGSRVICRHVMSRDRSLRECLAYVSTCHFDAFFFHFDAPPHLTADYTPK
jgi:hypothetical protein